MFILLLSIVSPCWAQLTGHTGQNLNYIVTEDVLVPGITNAASVQGLSVNDLSQRISYFDGLGRPIQHISTQGSPAKNDLVVPVLYDEFGREAYKYLPFAAEKNGRYKQKESVIDGSGNYTGIAAGFYGNASGTIADAGGKPFARTVFEAGPLNRVIEQGASGSAWQPDLTDSYNSSDHTIKKAYETNGVNEVLQWRYAYPSSPDVLGSVDASNGATRLYYEPNQLFKNKTKDEQQNEVIEYIDKDGRTILRRVQAISDTPAVNDSTYASTYYIYDDYGNLVCALPPEAVKLIIQVNSRYFGKTTLEKTTFLERWAFRYGYDHKMRQIIKQIPGAKPVYMIYDNTDRLVLTQDGNQRALSTKEWTFIKYDAFDRPVLSGTYASNADLPTLQKDVDDYYALAAAGTAWFETYVGSAGGNILGYDNKSFPQVTDVNRYLTVTYYDVYDAFIAPAAYAPSNQGLPAEQTATTDKKAGRVTGTLVRNLGTGEWMRSVNYYDYKYRPIQVVSDHHKQGTIRTSNVYDFVGRVLFTKRKYVVGTAETTVKESFTYDHAGRLLETRHSINGAADVVTSRNQYNELGQLIAKGLHKTGQSALPVTADPAIGQPGVVYGTEINSPAYNSAQHTYIATQRVRLQPGFKVQSSNTFKGRIGFSAGDAEAHNNAIVYSFRQTIDYRYNIRGWLTKINDPASPGAGDLFNLELRYNDPSVNGGSAQYNGNISEAIWSGSGTDKQSYGYTYDNLSRLTMAKYYNITTPAANGRYDEKIGTPERKAYDLNGNIKNLLRYGRTGESTFGPVDDLVYDYAENGNKLMSVADAVPTTPAEPGFKELVEGGSDHQYDDNGNLKTDANKGITEIMYNHLNLSSKVSKSASDYVTYTYDATGKKLAQQVFGAEVKTTDYVGELVYENGALKFMLFSEGRIVMTGATPEYQYHLKDHLGNVRVTFTNKRNTDNAQATMEDASAAGKFLYYNEAVKINTPLFDHTNQGATQYSTRLNGSASERTGLARSLSVMPGDTIKAEVYAKYLDTNSANWTSALNSLITSIANGTAPAGTFVDGGAAGSTGGVTAPHMSLLSKGSEAGTAPKAYLNYLVFDRDFNFLNGGFVRMTEAAKEYGQDGAHEKLATQFVITKPGYVYIYLSNDNAALGGQQVEVYFDDMSVTQSGASIVGMDDYYAFGLTFNSHHQENALSQNYKFNGKELQDEMGLGWLDYGARMYSPETGRWFVTDPMSEKYSSWSPYNYGINNPVRYIDPDGMDIVETSKSITYSGADMERYLRMMQISSRLSLGEQLTKIVNPEGTSYGFKYELQYNRPAADVSQDTDPKKEKDKAGDKVQQRDPCPTCPNPQPGPSLTDVLLAGIGTAGLVAEHQSTIIARSRSGFTSGKLSSNSPRIYSKPTAVKVNIAAKGAGWGLTFWSVYNTEAQFRRGEIDSNRRGYNHLNNGVGVIYPIAGLPLSIGDYLGQKYPNEIINDVSQPGGYTFDAMKWVFETIGIPTSPDKK